MRVLNVFETVYPACGSPNSAIELTIDELTEISGAETLDVCNYNIVLVF